MSTWDATMKGASFVRAGCADCLGIVATEPGFVLASVCGGRRASDRVVASGRGEAWRGHVRHDLVIAWEEAPLKLPFLLVSAILLTITTGSHVPVPEGAALARQQVCNPPRSQRSAGRNTVDEQFQW
jgi:hypothetical protein